MASKRITKELVVRSIVVFLCFVARGKRPSFFFRRRIRRGPVASSRAVSDFARRVFLRFVFGIFLLASFFVSVRGVSLPGIQRDKNDVEEERLRWLDDVPLLMLSYSFDRHYMLFQREEN